jgi:hypothetical protein
MFQNRRNFVVMLLALVASVFSSNAIQSSKAFAGGNKALRLEGRLVSKIGSDHIASVRKSNGQIVSISIPTTAKIERNGVTVALTAFKVNDVVQARFAANGTTIVKFEGVGP